ncbi:EAL domain-containing protein [Massilia sp. UMI-21]|nr:EAL domain-containing protein [Massilia sp. UMI-21]
MNTVNDLAGWRQRIFSSLLAVVLVVGVLATIPLLPYLIDQGMWPVVVADIVALVWIFVIWRLDHIAYTTRVLNFLGVVYALSIILMLSVGAASLSYLLGPPVIAAVMLNTRPAMLALALGVATLLALAGTGQVSLAVPGLEQQPFKGALVATMNMAGLGTMLVLTCSTLVKGLSRSLTDARGTAASLALSEASLRELNSELELTSAAVSRLNDLVVIARAVGGDAPTQPITFANDAFLRRTGYARSEIVGRGLRTLLGPDSEQAAIEKIDAAMAQVQPCTAELVVYAKDESPFWIELDMVPFSRKGERASHWVVVGRDITERRNAADAIHRLAYYDVLTGLPNRRLLMERLASMVDTAHAGRGLGAVLYIDLDDFKKVNDARGHATGDALLELVGTRLARVARAHDTVARLGGDEFVVLLAGLGTDAPAATRHALALAHDLRETLTRAVEIDGQTYYVSSSIGIALPLRAGQTAPDLLREADTAMYRAKADGRNGVALFETSMLAVAQRKLALERDLALALENGALAVHLQLQVDHRAMPSGAEVLLRWQRADGSFVAPDVFIPVAESSGLIVPLGRWVLREACRAWRVLDAAGHALPLSVNVSPLQFNQPDFVEDVRAVLHETGAPPQQFIFEVTEGLLITDVGQTIDRMRELAALGIRFSIDDFGTGYSNLAYLKKMPLYELKIDKSFMRDTPNDANGTAIVQSILAMANHLGLRVVAEGIEQPEQARFLAEHGQPCMQGYLFHRPVPLGQLLERLAGAPQGLAAFAG